MIGFCSPQQGMHSLHFASGNSFSADFVIGAEGSASFTRSLVTPERPSYAGGSFLEMGISQPSPQVSKTVGRGGMCALGVLPLVLLRALLMCLHLSPCEEHQLDLIFQSNYNFDGLLHGIFWAVTKPG